MTTIIKWYGVNYSWKQLNEFFNRQTERNKKLDERDRKRKLKEKPVYIQVR